MSSNPYLPPPSESPIQQELPSVESDRDYLPFNGLARWVTISIATICMIYVLVSAAETAGFLSFPKFSDPLAPVSSDAELRLIQFTAIVSLIGLPVILLTGIFVCKFMYRANSNLRHFGIQGLTVTPGWCCGYWFVPIINLVKPYQAMKEISLASEHGGNWQNEVGSAPFGWWWFGWIGGSLLARVESRLPATIDPGVWLLVLTWSSTILLGLAGFCLIKLVRQIERDQYENFVSRESA